MASRRYGRVEDAQAQAGRDEAIDTEEQRKRARAETIERISAKAQAAVWVIASVLLWIYGGLGTIIFDSTKTNVVFMAVGTAATGIVLVVFCYLVVYLRYVAGIQLDWQVYAPSAIPVATAAGVTAFLR